MPEPLVVFSTLDAAIRSISQVVRLLREVKPGSGKPTLEDTRKEMASGFEALEASLKGLQSELARLQGCLQGAQSELEALRARVAALETAEARRRGGLWDRLARAFRRNRQAG
ncbi:MAG: hypothetical protein N2109_09235 [Fimbriimonadales bacterium]|nr:hypothetical protein [Fimbriimonadales bacterium]